VKIITALAVVVMLLLNAFGPKSSVGGPLTGLFFSLLIMWVIGAYRARSKNFGPPGWLLSMVGAIVGGFVALILFNTAMETVMTVVHFEGRLIDSQWSYAVELMMVFFAMFGSWLPIEPGNRLLARRVRQKPIPSSTRTI
jgi:hypothetical protein